MNWESAADQYVYTHGKVQERKRGGALNHTRGRRISNGQVIMDLTQAGVGVGGAESDQRCRRLVRMSADQYVCGPVCLTSIIDSYSFFVDFTLYQTLRFIHIYEVLGSAIREGQRSSAAQSPYSGPCRDPRPTPVTLAHPKSALFPSVDCEYIEGNEIR